jgi:flagellin
VAITFGKNISVLASLRALDKATSESGAISRRLASGLRINTASDDAAGLAISSELSSRTRVYSQAIRNANDGISALNIADSTTSNLSDVVIRLRELAEQAANGSYSYSQRSALQAEAQAMSKEYFRLSRSASFNGLNVFDGTLGAGLRIQLGYGTSGGIATSIGGSLGNGTLGSGSAQGGTGAARSSASADLNGDGNIDLVTADGGSSSILIQLGNGNGSLAAAQVTTSAATLDLALGDLNNDGIIDLVTTGASGARLLLGNGDGSFSAATSIAGLNSSLTLSDINKDGKLDLITGGPSGVQINLGNGNGSFQASVSLSAGVIENIDDIGVADLNNDGRLDIAVWLNGASSGTLGVALGNGNGTFGAIAAVGLPGGESSATLSLGDVDNDGDVDILLSDTDSAAISILQNNGNATFSQVYVGDSDGPSKLADLNGDGLLDIISSNSGIDVRFGAGNGTFGAPTNYLTGQSSSYLEVNDFNNDGVLDLVSSGGSNNSLALGGTRDGVAPILEFSLLSVAEAKQALSLFDKTLATLGSQRGVIGSNLSRLQAGVNAIVGAKENYEAANSRIRDADIAEESARLVRNRILQETATSLLAQANQQPALILSLL